jgi:4-hydroxy-3-methylbut-2-enyl diphosphate reductase
MTIHVGTLTNLPAEARTVVFIGHRSSDHLRELARIAEHRGRSAYRIEAAADLQPRWFAGTDEVGIVVGADDLQDVLCAVVARLNEFSGPGAGKRGEGCS